MSLNIAEKALAQPCSPSSGSKPTTQRRIFPFCMRTKQNFTADLAGPRYATPRFIAPVKKREIPFFIDSFQVKRLGFDALSDLNVLYGQFHKALSGLEVRGPRGWKRLSQRFEGSSWKMITATCGEAQRPIAYLAYERNSERIKIGEVIYRKGFEDAVKSLFVEVSKEAQRLKCKYLEADAPRNPPPGSANDFSRGERAPPFLIAIFRLTAPFLCCERLKKFWSVA